MPKINGYELCRMLRNFPGFKQTLIIVVTGRKGSINQAKAKLVGATDYLENPFNRDALLSTIYKNLPDLEAADQ